MLNHVKPLLNPSEQSEKCLVKMAMATLCPSPRGHCEDEPAMFEVTGAKGLCDVRPMGGWRWLEDLSTAKVNCGSRTSGTVFCSLQQLTNHEDSTNKYEQIYIIFLDPCVLFLCTCFFEWWPIGTSSSCSSCTSAGGPSMIQSLQCY